jgi:hypothetical protein
VSLSIAEAGLLQELVRFQRDIRGRVEALEARVGQPLYPLDVINAQRVAAAQKLRQAIATTIAAHPGIVSKQVEGVLVSQGWTPLPSARTIRWHMQQIRRGGNAA